MRHARAWIGNCLAGGIGACALPAALLFAVAMGQRSSLGLFLSPINTSTGAGFAALSFALAASQLAAGLSQPLCGLLSERFGAARVVAVGAVLVAASSAATVLAGSATSLAALLIVAGAAGSAAGGAPLLLGIVGQRVVPERRGLAAGIVSAGGSCGQMAVAPLAQGSIVTLGWSGAMLLMSLLSLLVAPLALAFRRRNRNPVLHDRQPPDPGSAALRDPGFWLISAGFGVCGFHVGFLTAHMPGVIEACGQPAALAGLWLAIVGACNIAGSIVSGALTQTRSMPRMLAGVYLARALGVLVFVSMPVTQLGLLLFAVWMGTTYMATVPPTSGLIAARYGNARLARLFGVAMLVHQLGGFAGVWLGGVVFEASGRYDGLWAADVVLSLAAAAAYLP
ncbi:MAG: MFS transporter, partial [Limnobacter sp.]|nr:MFS transporter [Limnobacter sp.]